MATNSALHARLDALYDTWMKLSPESSPSEFETFANFFDEDCQAWLLSMRELSQPSVGRKGVIKGIQEVLTNTRIKQRRVIDRFEGGGGSKVSVEMSNQLVVQGKEVESFPETVTAIFNDKGLITDFKLYCCRSPVVEIIQEVTGEGPYKIQDKCH
ncbi:hypothetical protein GGR54DRAFT_448898 [Hypoxylon sp. NC1633]|nr:hypothetical protein GGR54DRAFT_448898 [Hypoxylon sp. NC1633]